jgi:NAD(P)H-hydrate repair Nnr-like enzyme with NAD(P)H-hydrate dehydratase domain
VARGFAGLPPRRASGGNKGDYGHVAIVAGSLGFHGAAVLTAHGAQRAQPGWSLFFRSPPFMCRSPPNCNRPWFIPWRAGAPLPKKCSSILVRPRPGGGRIAGHAEKDLRSLWRTWPLAMVVDASALDWLEPGSVASQAIRVITPHPGEAGRFRQPASGARRQRGFAGRIFGGPAGTTGLAQGPVTGDSFRRLAARCGCGSLDRDARELDGGGSGTVPRKNPALARIM